LQVKRRAIVGDDAGGILSAMLEQQVRRTTRLTGVGDDAYDSAHVRCSLRPAEESPAGEIGPVGPSRRQIRLQRQGGLRQRLPRDEFTAIPRAGW
jgi:hypothetical protein